MSAFDYFVSWITLKNGDLRYLSDIELNSEKGKKIIKDFGESFYLSYNKYALIEKYFDIGENLMPFSLIRGHSNFHICNDFSKPENFPTEIAEKIKRCEFSKVGMPVCPEEVLNKKAMTRYEQEVDRAKAKYLKQQTRNVRKYKLKEKRAIYIYQKNLSSSSKHNNGPKLYSAFRHTKSLVNAEFLRNEETISVKYIKARLNIFWTLFSNIENRQEVWK